MEENKWERRWPPELPYDYAALNLEKALLIIEASKKKANQIGFSVTGPRPAVFPGQAWRRRGCLVS